jgi:RNA polymerase sigma factor (sigma-70 family)
MIGRYGKLITRVIARVGGQIDASARDDVEQKVLIALWKQVSGEQRVDHPASYIYRAAVRETVRALRQRQRPDMPASDEEEMVQVADPKPDSQQQLMSQQQAHQLEAALKTLAPERAIAVRAHLLGFEVEELMTIHNWPYQKARNLIARGMADLRQALMEAEVHG